MTASAFIGFALVLAIVVVAAVVIAMAAIGKRRHARPATADDEPTGYVPGVWLLGGEESAAPRGGHFRYDHHGHDDDAHGVDAGGAHGAVQTPDAPDPFDDEHPAPDRSGQQGEQHGLGDRTGLEEQPDRGERRNDMVHDRRVT